MKVKLILIVLVLVLASVLLSACGGDSYQTPPTVEVTGTPAGAITASASATLPLALAPVPLCTFSGSPTATAPAREAYVFSEPKVVFTSLTAIGIAGWLPDGERLLITQDAPQGHQLIKTLNIRTGATQVYADRYGANGKPVWIPASDAVVYSAVGKQGDELWISYGDPQKAERIAPNVEGLTLATDGQHLVYFSPSTGDHPQVWSANTKTTQSMAVDLAQWYQYSGPEAYKPLPGRTFHTAWQPGGKQIAFYGYTKLFLMDSQALQGCEVDLNQGDKPRSVFYVQWSPDGRYLAMIMVDPPPSSSSTRLAMLDTVTGEKYYPVLPTPRVFDVGWLSNSQSFVIDGQIDVQDGLPLTGLYSVSVPGFAFQRILPTYVSSPMHVGWELSYSSNGNVLAVKCPTWSETTRALVQDQICLVNISSQP